MSTTEDEEKDEKNTSICQMICPMTTMMMTLNKKTIEIDNEATNMATAVDSDAHVLEDAERFQQSKIPTNDATDNKPKLSSTTSTSKKARDDDYTKKGPECAHHYDRIMFQIPSVKHVWQLLGARFSMTWRSLENISINMNTHK
jgi:hypothetical protein